MSGIAAVTATSRSRPTSAMSRVMRSPPRAELWNRIDRRSTWEYTFARTEVIARVPARAKNTVMR